MLPNLRSVWVVSSKIFARLSINEFAAYAHGHSIVPGSIALIVMRPQLHVETIRRSALVVVPYRYAQLLGGARSRFFFACYCKSRYFVCNLFCIVRTRRLPYEDKMHTKSSKELRESAGVSDCTKISCLQKFGDPQRTKILCARNILELQYCHRFMNEDRT